MSKRIRLIFYGFIVLWVILLARAVQVQLLPNDKLLAIKQKQFNSIIQIQSRRGPILDRNGKELAVSSVTYSLYADPRWVAAPKKTSKKLAKILGHNYESIYNKIKDSEKRFVWIERFLTESKANEIRELNIKGLSFVEEWKRVYPNESLLAHTLGMVGSEGQGLEGLELGLEELLQGEKRKMTVPRDARGRPLITDGLLVSENAEGNEVILTIDGELQYQLEKELKNAMNEFSAMGAVGVILDAKTSAIRAIASEPSFNANSPLKYPAEMRRHKAITDAIEPGSTMKSFVIAKGLKEKLIQPNAKFFCENGSFKVGDRVIKEADENHKFGNLTVAEILAHSSNVGTTKIAMKLGANKIRESLIEFGFSQKTGVEISGDAKGTVHELPWNDHLLANVSFGQGMTASPLQIANAYAAMVNGGNWHAPYLVESIRDHEGKERRVHPERSGRQVLSSEDSEKMRIMLMGATQAGSTGEKAKVPGFLIGGKTGTAQKVNPNGRGYLKGSYISSFAGFIPAHDPALVIYIAVDQPQKTYYGSQVAAPVFSRLASFGARQMGLAPVLLTSIEEQAKKNNKIKTLLREKLKKQEVLRESHFDESVLDSSSINSSINNVNSNASLSTSLLNNKIQTEIKAPKEIKSQSQNLIRGEDEESVR